MSFAVKAKLVGELLGEGEVGFSLVGFIQDMKIFLVQPHAAKAIGAAREASATYQIGTLHALFAYHTTNAA